MAFDSTLSGTSANSYISVSDADSYIADRYGDEWVSGGISDAEKQRFLIRATEYIEQRYLSSWQGLKVVSNQSLSFPRTGVYDYDDYEITSTAIPPVLVAAVAEAAYKLANGTDITQDIGRATKSERVEGAVEVEYMEGMPSTDYYASIHNQLSVLTKSKNSPNSNICSVQLFRG